MNDAGTMGLQTRIERERAAASPDAKMVKTFRQYTRGRQRATLTAGMTSILRGLLGNLFCDNICRMVVQAPANRLQLARFDVAGDQTTATAIQSYLSTLWTLTGLPSLSAAVHWATLRDGNHAVMLKWVDGRVVLTREPWWNGERGIFVAYDDDARPDYAVKEWKSAAGQRRTVYFADRIERYIQSGEGWTPFHDPTDGGVWPAPWLDANGAPLGLPVVHFANHLLPNDGPGEESKEEPDSRYGMSELDGGVLGLQDEINDLHRDISAAARFAGFQMLWGAGVEPDIDPDTGNPRPLKVEPGQFFRASSPDAKFGTFPPGSLAELERALNLKLRAVSRASDVPMHLIAGEWPSGEALLRAEMGLIEKVEKLGESIGPAWASVAHKATKLANTFGGESFDEAAMVAAVFAPVARRDLLTLADIADRLSKHVGRRETLKLLGYAPAEVERIIGELDADIATATAAFGQAFDKGAA